MAETAEAPEAEAPAGSGRMPWVDILKGIAMLGVIVIHTFAPSFGQLPPLVARVMSNCARGAQVFIVASAFLAFGSAARLALRRRRWSATYVMKRFLRLAPLYYVAIATYLLVNGMGRNFWTGGRPITWLNVAAHVAFVNEWVPWWINSIMYVEWTIGVLAVFFVLVPLLARWIRDLRGAVAGFAVTLVVAIGLNRWLLTIPAPIKPAYLWREYMGIWFFSQAPVLLAGIVAYYADQTLLAEKNGGRVRRAALAVGVAATAIALLSFGGRAALAPSVVFGVAGAAILVGVCRSHAGVSALRPLAFLGKVSLGVYLFHLLLVELIVRWMSALTGLPQYLFALRLICFPIVIVTSAGVGYLAMRFVEKPVAAMSDRWLAARAGDAD